LELWAPQKIDTDMLARRSDEIEEVLYILGLKVRELIWAAQHLLVFEKDWS
jgi:hypothetical protein